MNYIKFNGRDQLYDLAISFRPELGLIQLDGVLPSNVEVLKSGFKLVDEERNVIDSFDDYVAIWEQSANYVILCNETVTYYYYFVADSTGYAVDQYITVFMEHRPDCALYKYGKKQEDTILQNYPLKDEDGFWKYRIVNGELIATTEQEKDEWLNQWRYNIIFITDDKYVSRFKVQRVSLWEKEKTFKGDKKAIYQTIVRKTGKVDDIKVDLVDEDGYPKYKIVDGVLSEITAEELNELQIERTRKREEERRQAEQESHVRKVQSLREECQRKIVDGIEVGGKHYSYDASDQANIANLVGMAKEMQVSLPYHADNESCRLFTVEELIALYTLQEFNVTYQTTYYNQAKLMVEAMTNWEDWDQFSYGSPLTGKYLETFNAMMKSAQGIARQILGYEIDINDIVPENEEAEPEVAAE